MAATGNGGPESEEIPKFTYGLTAGVFTVASGMMGCLALHSEQWDPASDTGTNVLRGVFALGLAALAVNDWQKFNQEDG